MRKTLMMVLIVLLVILCCYTVISGINIGNLSIAGIMQIKEDDENLDEKISEASKLSSTDYQKALSDLNSSYKDLQTEKEDYNNLVIINEGADLQSITQYGKYEMETLWVKLGNYATADGVDIKLGISNSSSTDITTDTDENGNPVKLYDIKFTCTGSYVGITQLIYDIENDSELGFKIEDFKMIPSTDTDLQGTFTCKGISIKNIDSVQATTSSSTADTNTTTNNTTNTTANTTTNTTNTVQ